MIPRFKANLSILDLLAALAPPKGAVKKFERVFAEKFGCKFGVSFAYGRTAIWAFLKSQNIQNKEIIMPAYTCSVVAHAVTLSGNMPRFVDIDLDDYNASPEQIEAAVNENTKAIIVTHLFGFPSNVDKIKKIRSDAEKKYGTKIWIIQDCAHSFGARLEGVQVSAEEDLAIFGLNLSKLLTCISGGMLITNNAQIIEDMRLVTNNFIRPTTFKRRISKLIYLFLAYFAFSRFGYFLTYFLTEKTTLLKNLTDAYHLDDKIAFPPDAFVEMGPAEAGLGLKQLEKYDDIIEKRQTAAAKYYYELAELGEFRLPDTGQSGTFSHFPVRVANKKKTIEFFGKKGVQLGEVIQYSVSEMSSYRTSEVSFPNSLKASQHVVNFPIHVSKTHEINKIIRVAKEFSKCQSVEKGNG